jgi:hypothetical protein
MGKPRATAAKGKAKPTAKAGPKAVPKVKAKAKAKATAKATPKAKAKHVPAVKTEPCSPRKKKTPATSSATVESGLGFDRGTISGLLTSLKYQTVAKKTGEQDKADAQTVLQEYLHGDLDTKRTILQKLYQGGVKQCSWVHSLQTGTDEKESSEEKVRTVTWTRRLGSVA